MTTYVLLGGSIFAIIIGASLAMNWLNELLDMIEVNDSQDIEGNTAHFFNW